MLARFSLVAFCLGLSSAAFAQALPGPGLPPGMYPNASNATLPTARYNLGPNNACNPVTDYDADPTGAADATAAINLCAVVTKNGQLVNIYLPAGVFYVKSAITLTGAQCIYGDGIGSTIISVDQSLDPAAEGVIILNTPSTGDETVAAGCVHDIGFSFAQPSDQGTRANFAALGTCTSSFGGTGCKYPPAVYQPSTSSGRVKLYNLLWQRAWDGINLQHAGGAYIANIKDGSLDVGLTIANGHDFGYLSNWEHWNFGITGTLSSGVYSDGNTFAAKIGETDGMYFHGFRTFQGRIALTSAFTWGTFSDLALDGDNSTLEVAATISPGLQINTVYSTGEANGGTDTHCSIDIGSAATTVDISNFTSTSGSYPSLCVAGGNVTLSGGVINTSVNARSILVSGGSLTMTGISLPTNTAVAYTHGIIAVTNGAAIVATGNTIANPPTLGDTTGWMDIQTENANNYVANNSLNGWSFLYPTPSSGVYWPNSRDFGVGSLNYPGTLSANGITGGNLTDSAMTSGSVLFSGTAGIVAQDNANLFWDATNHRLGIGVVVPETLIEADGSSTDTNTAFNGILGFKLKNTSNTAGNYTSITNSNAANAIDAGIYFKNIDQTNEGRIDFVTRYSGGYSQRMVIEGNGNVLIGTTTDAGQLLQVNGAAAFSGNLAASAAILNTGITTDATHTDATVCEDTTSHQFYYGSGAVGICLGTSSLRFKQDIRPLTAGLDDVLRLRPIQYRYKPGYGTTDRDLFGFAAEQVNGVLPKLVGLDAEGRPNSVDWAGMVPVLVKAIQEQQAEIAALKARLK